MSVFACSDRVAPFYWNRDFPLPCSMAGANSVGFG